MDAAGIVLVGGRSTRMGRAKADLEWHGSTLAYRVVSLLQRSVTGPVVVVGAPDQVLPMLPDQIEVVTDRVIGQGPLQGIAVGLAQVGSRSAVAFVASTDLPLLHPAFVRRVLRETDDPDIDVALPVLHGYRQPLAAAYRTSLAPHIERLLADGVRWMPVLFEQCRVARLDASALLVDPALARVDPELDSVLNINDPDGYAAARARPAPLVRVGGQLGNCADLAGAAQLAGVRPGAGPVVVNGRSVAYRGEFPLVAGDEVSFGPGA